MSGMRYTEQLMQRRVILPPLPVIQSTSVTSTLNSLSNTEEHEDKEPLNPNDVSKYIKSCPFCGKATFKDGGCNYMKCSESDPPSACIGEWCFLCHKPKYTAIEGKEHKGFCDNADHNSH